MISTDRYATKQDLENLLAYISSTICYPIMGVGGGDAPIGKIAFFDAIVAPQGYLICDGTVYNIDDYPELATHYASVHGSSNFYGGDGVTTFAVPDLRGEFLRGTGTNSHSGQGSGAAVGTHQDGTRHTQVTSWSNTFAIGNYENMDHFLANRDSYYGSESNYVLTTGTPGSSTTDWNAYTSRPTNTSFLICVKATPSGIQYSENEQVIGSWTTGKPIYEKTIPFTYPTSGYLASIPHGVTNFGSLISIEVRWYDTIENKWYCGNRIHKGGSYNLNAEGIGADTTNVLLSSYPETGVDWGSRTSNCSVTIRYTKSSD